jgi:citrate synthase
MMADIKENVKDITNYKEVEKYLLKILHGEANDGSGLIYGLGHAVYTISDPRGQAAQEDGQEARRGQEAHG